jgi:hypothetical protein
VLMRCMQQVIVAVCMIMGDDDFPRRTSVSKGISRTPGPREQDHPSAAHSKPAPVANEAKEDVEAEQEQRSSNKTPHHGIHFRRDSSPQFNRYEPEKQHDDRMTKRIQRGKTQ